MSIFLYHKNGDTMKVYIDVIFLLNIFFDFLLLLSVSLILRRHTKIYRLILGGLVGGISIIFLFFNISVSLLFFLKIKYLLILKNIKIFKNKKKIKCNINCKYVIMPYK